MSLEKNTHLFSLAFKLLIFSNLTHQIRHGPFLGSFSQGIHKSNIPWPFIYPRKCLWKRRSRRQCPRRRVQDCVCGRFKKSARELWTRWKGRRPSGKVKGTSTSTCSFGLVRRWIGCCGRLHPCLLNNKKHTPCIIHIRILQ